MNTPFAIAIILLQIFASVAFAGAGLTYHGRLVSPTGEPVVAPSVLFRVQIRTPGAENCLLYEEQQVKDLSGTKGVFALNINDGTATVVNTEPFTLDRAFQNRGTFSFGAGKCSGGPTYAPNPTDGRKLVVEFNDGSFTGWEQMPVQSINYVPMAIESMTVGGYNASSLVRVVDGSGAPSPVSPLTQTQHNALLDLVNGTSASYLSTSSPAVGFTGSLSGDVTGTQSATVVTKIQGRAVDTSAPVNGQALVWDATDNRWEPGTVSGGGGGDWSTLTGKPATFPSDWSTLSNIPTTFAPSAHSHPINEITSGVGSYFNYSPNGATCTAGEVLKWDTGGGGRWVCGTDAGSGGTLVSLTTNSPIVKTGTASDPILSISDASTTAKGIVQLAASSDTTAGLVVQANDSRLTDGRAPTGTAGGELSGNYPNPTVVASVGATNNSLVRRDGSGGITGAAGNFSSLALTNGTSTLTLSTPVAFTTYATKLPASSGSNGQVMTSNGTDMIWSNASTLTAGNVSGIVAIANGGTGATTASGARTNLGLTATGDALATAADAAAARSAISAMLDVAPGTSGNVLTSNGTAWVSAPFAVNAANVGSSVGGYFTYKPNNGACADGEVMKWTSASGGRWICGTDVSSTGGSGVASVSATAPVTVDNADPNNPRVQINTASTSATGVVQLATSADTAAGLVVQANDTRLTNSRAPSGTAGGDLTGNYPNPTIAKLQTKDITLASLASGDVLKYDGTKWVNAPPTDADTLGGMSCSSGDVALYNGSTWTCVGSSTTSSNNALVRRDGSGNISAAAGTLSSLVLTNGTSTITLSTPIAFTTYAMKLPSTAGSSGQILTSNGTDMIWSTPSYMASVAPGANGNILLSNGTSWTSAALPADANKVSKTGDTMSGSLTLSAGSLVAPANGLAIGTNQLVASGGNVGIGSTSPAANLDIAGGVATTTPMLNLSNTINNAGGAGVQYGVKVVTAANRQATAAYGVYSLYQASNNAFTSAGVYGETSGQSTSGGVTIGVRGKSTVVAGSYSVAHGVYGEMVSSGAGGTSTSYAGYFNNAATAGGTNYGAYVNAATGGTTTIPLAIAVDGSEKIRVDSSGSLGIGTTTPQSALQVKGYAQLDTVSGAPPSADCDAAPERGRMKVDPASGALYVCMDSGWVNTAAGTAIPSGTHCGGRQVACYNSTPNYDQDSSSNVACAGNTLTATCSNAGSYYEVSAVSGCPAGYTGRSAYMGANYDVRNNFLIYCSKN